jgi:uncharacterized protein involved in type VI secretion and phage assembly
MSLTRGLVVGKVVRWPEGSENRRMGEVLVKMPVTSDQDDFKTARIVMPMAGNDTGLFFMPEPGDEVVLGFLNGDTNHPYVLGFVWNGKRKPPADDYAVRTLKTKAKHTIEMNDKGGQERILIKTGGGRTIEIKDSPTGQITIETQGGTIVISDTPPSVTITSKLTMRLEAKQATISAQQLLVDAKATTFTGTVQVLGSIQTTAMVSSAYNPLVPGNLFGL